jgi:class 3 adenylate cyclase
MFPSLSWQCSAGKNRTILVQERIYIGRTCTGVPEDKRILIRDQNVSRDHAVITFFGGLLIVKDTGRNGTRLNSTRITPGVEHPLKNSDILEIGTCKFHVTLAPNSAHFFNDTSTISETQTVALEEYVTHLVADVRGFSTLSQRNNSADVYAVMSEMFSLLSKTVHAYHGTVKDYAGDAIFAYWEHGDEETSRQAVCACRAACKQLSDCNNLMAAFAAGQGGIGPLRIGWGISTGKVTLAHYGLRNDNVAVVGDSTNLAFRLSGLANKTLVSPIILCANTARLVDTILPVSSMGHVHTKGRTGKEHVFGLDDTPLDVSMSSQSIEEIL